MLIIVYDTVHAINPHNQQFFIRGNILFQYDAGIWPVFITESHRLKWNKITYFQISSRQAQLRW